MQLLKNTGLHILMWSNLLYILSSKNKMLNNVHKNHMCVKMNVHMCLGAPLGSGGTSRRVVTVTLGVGRGKDWG